MSCPVLVSATGEFLDSCLFVTVVIAVAFSVQNFVFVGAPPFQGILYVFDAPFAQIAAV